VPNRLALALVVGVLAVAAPLASPTTANAVSPERQLSKETGFAVRHSAQLHTAQRVAACWGLFATDWEYVRPRVLRLEVASQGGYSGWLRVRFPKRRAPTFVFEVS
jgi:hypothetical protein